MADEGRGKTAIIVALIGLFGTLFATTWPSIWETIHQPPAGSSRTQTFGSAGIHHPRCSDPKNFAILA